MMRSILGLAILAVVALVVIKIAFSLVGPLFALAFLLLKLAVIGLVVYWVLKLISPGTARKVDDMIKGNR